MQQAGRELTSVDLRVVTNDKQDFLGSTGQTGDGRIFRYVQNGSVAAPSGTLLALPYTTNFVGLTVAAASSTLISQNVYELKVQLGATGVAQNELMDGEVDILTGTGKGISYRIRGNNAASANGVVTLVLYSQLLSAVPAGSIVNLGYSLFYNLTTDVASDQAGSNTNKHFVGIVSAPLGPKQFGWLQTHGRGLALSDNTYYDGSGTPANGPIPKGYSLVPSKINPGQVTGSIPSKDADKQLIGYGLENPYTAGAGVLFPIDISIE